MGAEGGVVWVTLLPEGDRDEVLNLFELVGINPSTRGGREDVRSWMHGSGPTEEGIDDLSIVDEWNTCLPWLGLRELEGIWDEMVTLESGEHTESYLGLGPDSTLQDIALESLTTTPPIDYTYPTKTILEGMGEAHRKIEDILGDPNYKVTVREWCNAIRGNLLFTGRFWRGASVPLVVFHEVWT